MILVGWKTDRTIEYLSDRLQHNNSPVHTIFLDTLVEETDAANRSLEWAIQEFRNILANSPGNGIYPRLLNPFSDADPRSMLIFGLSEEIDNLHFTSVCNKTSAISTNFSKIVHLHRYRQLLRDCNVFVPRTLLTNELNQSSVTLFQDAGELVIKGASSKKSICSLLDSVHFGRSAGGRCVALLQERIDGPDVRVHITPFGYSAEGFVSSDIDYRFSKNKRCFPVQLPSNVEDFCRKLIAFEEVMFAGIDFKLRSNGDWFFLEANSSPAFQGFDKRARGAIVAMLIAWDSSVREARK